MSKQAADEDENPQESGAASSYSAIASMRESGALRFVEQMNNTDLAPLLDTASLVDEIDPTPMLGAAARMKDVDPTPMLRAASLTDEIDPTSMLGAAARMNDIDLTPMLRAASLVDEIDPTPVLGAAARMDNTNIAPMLTGIEQADDIDPTPMFAAAEAAENLNTALQPTVNLAAQKIGQYPELAASVFDIVEAVSQVPYYQEPFVTRGEPFSTDVGPELPGPEFPANQPTTGLANGPAIEIRELIAEYIARARTEDDGYVELTNAQWISVSLAVGVVVGYCTDPQTGRAVSTALSVYGIAQN